LIFQYSPSPPWAMAVGTSRSPEPFFSSSFSSC
jgi:hypothetical protein